MRSGRTMLYVICDCQKVPDDFIASLEAHYEVTVKAPRVILKWSAGIQEHTLRTAQAILICWQEEAPDVLVMLKPLAVRYAVPLMAVCGADETEQVAALVLGADEVVKHPVNPVVLKAWLMAYRRRMSPTRAGGVPGGDGWAGPAPLALQVRPVEVPVCRVGPLTLDSAARRFYANGRLLKLAPREFDLLAFLMARADVCASRDAILNHVWGIDYETETNILDVQIYTLRCKLRAHGLHEMIQTVRGHGYRLVTPRR